MLIHFFLFPKIEETTDNKVRLDLKELRSRGYFVALTDKNSYSYYAYNGGIIGFQYDMLKKFSDYLKLPVKIIIENDYERAISLLQHGKCDIIAKNLTITNERKKRMKFTEPILQTTQVLVQRKRNVGSPNYISSILDLGGKTIHVKTNSSFHERLLSLSDEIGDSINIITNSTNGTETLIKKVALGLINYTVSDIQTAELNALYYPNLDVSLRVSLEQNMAWAVRDNTPVLLSNLNKWLKEFKGSSYFKSIFYKYFKSSVQVLAFNSEYASIRGNKISDFDNYIKEYSRIIDWDWRLLASLIYQESRFNPDLTSRMGAIGLMQLMPATAERFGIDSTSSYEDHIKAGVLLIKKLDLQLSKKVENAEERKKFIIAAYNVGIGHIFDAQALALKHGRNPQIWDKNVDYYLLNKSNPKYANDTLVRHGNIRGRETYAMVREVFERYEHYKNLYKK
ncbi:MAG: transporter substrate-binding domain-containing protein [Bacteroidales bacterium]|nr:transporter substrate-binding domain-containing protein [Bacteroidales bacterium]